MADHKKEKPVEKSPVALREEETLKYWKDNDIFKKSLEKDSPKGEFVFYDGPPFATGEPHYGHLLPGTAKDVIPRFKTMQGYHVPRRWGWDTHGLPIENLIEKELGLKNKKDIEDLGVEKFNEAARAAVLRYDHIWKEIIPRTGRFVDMDNAYLTLQPSYSESIWWSFKTLHDKGLVYNGFKSMMLCPHCGTTLSNFEVAQGYKDITDISVYVKFELVDEPGTYVLAWTTTPWTLPGNVALAVGPDIDYVKVRMEDGLYILGKERLAVLKDKPYEVVEEMKGSALVGKKYKPVFNYYVHAQLQHHANGWKIVPADFVTTDSGTGVVHIAPAFGEDDYNLSLKEKLPFIQHVAQDGTFKKEVTDFAGQAVKPKDDHQKADVEIIKYLAKQGSLFAKEKIIHSYPHCWRCDTPLLNYATSSWFVEVTKFRDQLVAENKGVNWVPKEIGEGRFGKWLENARDWAVSRSRYWGAPIPVWKCKECEQTEVMGSVDDIRFRTKRNNYYVIRHGEADHNVLNVLSSDPKNPHHLTERGREEVALSAQALEGKKIDLIVTSPMVRTKETADVLVEQLMYTGKVEVDDRLTEYNFGDLNLQPYEKYHTYFNSVGERLTKCLPNGECINDVRKRIGEFIYDIDSQYQDKNIVIVTHDGPATLLFATAEGADDKRVLELWGLDTDFLSPGQMSELNFAQIPHDRNYVLDLHRPYIDDVTFECSRCRGDMKRVPEVFDTWYESGSMPYASIHYPFENKERFEKSRFPADFIAESQDQTRGWFYSLLVLATGLFEKAPYKNVVVSGIVLAEDGQKMSKRLKNYPEITYIFDKYGADAMRYYLMSSPVVHAEDLAFSEKGVDEVYKKIILRLQNVYTFYETYRHEEKAFDHKNINNVLDQWILARLSEMGNEITTALERYELDRAAKPILGFIDDLSTWYLRRSRDRFKGDDEHDKQSALHTMRYVLRELAKYMAPFTPFIAEDIYQKVKVEKDPESVHLASWPETKTVDENLITTMSELRMVVSEGLEMRASAGIKIRQPLSTFTLFVDPANIEKNAQLVELIRDELNVKHILFEKKTDQHTRQVGVPSGKLNTEITPELKLEGQAREFIRAIQDLRKKSNFNPTDIVTLTVATNEEGKTIINTFIDDISKTAQLKSVTFADTEGEKITIEDTEFTVRLEK